MTTPTSVKDMSPEQRNLAFEKWMEGDADKKIKNTAKRNAVTLLKKAHEKQYDTFVEAELEKLRATA